MNSKKKKRKKERRDVSEGQNLLLGIFVENRISPTRFQLSEGGGKVVLFVKFGKVARMIKFNVKSDF